MTWSMLRAILILPGTVLVYIPAALIWFSRGTAWAAGWPPAAAWQWLAGLAAALPALALMAWSNRVFLKRGGGGTPAPWDPIPNFVTDGPYAHMRNPMLTGVCLFLLAEAILLGSLAILAWALLFTAGNHAYFKYREEPELIARHGAPYRAYLRAVPRWLPRRRPYRPEDVTTNDASAPPEG